MPRRRKSTPVEVASSGGRARADLLPANRRSEIAKKAAAARWSGPVIWAKCWDRPVRIGEIEIPCYVLEDERRVFTHGGMLAAFGMSKGGSGYTNKPGERLARFVAGKNINPFIPKALIGVIEEPIRFRAQRRGSTVGYAYEATVLADLCEAVLKASRYNALQPNQFHIAERCELLMRGFQRIGIIALVDEATGYQKDRARDALAEILEAFIAKELRPYIRMFPSEFYENLFRLRGLEFPDVSGKKPQYFGHLTNDIVYARLAPGVLEELRQVVPRREGGKGYKYPFTRRLTEDVGHPKLREHLASVTTIMKLSDEYDDFEIKLDRIHPRYDRTLPLSLRDDEGEPV